MSEQSNNVVPLDDYRRGNRFDNDDQIDLHKNISVPSYNYEAILAARKSFEQPTKTETDPVIVKIREVARDLSNLAAVRRHETGDQHEDYSPADERAAA